MSYLGLTSPVIAVGNNAVDTLQLADNAVTTAKIAASGVTTAKIADANITAAKIAASQVLPAAGIAFPASQSASSDANTLDDYEEGTWTPVFQSDTPGTGRVTSVANATYVKIGRQVTVEFEATITTLGSGGSGVWVINGLPFSTAYGGAFSVGYANALLSPVYALAGEANGARIVMRISTASTTAPLGNNANFSTYVTGGTSVNGTCTYFV